ncbi:hypothetical protein ACFVWR_06985 [Leifsonia sp. NPDC058292]|uniref:hypothetical protein n=1 Tax=Leifsonia sp. NPDC058292 TaxID=3346428 RepID=UPI0036D7A677
MAEPRERRQAKPGVRNRDLQLFYLRLVLLLGSIAALLFVAFGFIARKDPVPAFVIAVAMAVLAVGAVIRLVLIRRR